MTRQEFWTFIKDAQWEADQPAILPILVERLSYLSLSRLEQFHRHVQRTVQVSWSPQLLNACFLLAPTLGTDGFSYAQAIGFLMRYGKSAFVHLKQNPDRLLQHLPLGELFPEPSLLEVSAEAYFLTHSTEQSLPTSLTIAVPKAWRSHWRSIDQFRQVLPQLTRQCWRADHQRVLNSTSSSQLDQNPR